MGEKDGRIRMEKKAKKKICILYTGGTVGMVPTALGYAPKTNYFSQKLREIPQIRADAMPLYDIVEFDPLLDSSNVGPEQWYQIGSAVQARYRDYDGFVVLHGTDTMAYTASALSFMREGLEKPVILTGSQIPLCEIRSDAVDNLENSLYLAADGRVREVCIYFANKLLRGCRATKMSSDELVAFASPNYPILADVGIRIRYHEESLKRPGEYSHLPEACMGGGLSLARIGAAPIGLIRLFPGIDLDFYREALCGRYRAVVLEVYGTGNLPSNDEKLLLFLEKAHAGGMLIVVSSQCYQGATSIGTYAAGSVLAELGAVDCHDMTTEAVMTKLMYLIGKGYGQEKIREEMQRDLVGEITETGKE